MEAQNLRAFWGIFNDTLTVTIFVVLLAGFDIGLALGEHEIDEVSQIVGGGGDRVGPIHARAQLAAVACRADWLLRSARAAIRGDKRVERYLSSQNKSP